MTVSEARQAVEKAQLMGAESVPRAAAEALQAELREQQQRAEAMCRLLDEALEEARKP